MQRRDFVRYGTLISGVLLAPDWKLFAAGRLSGTSEQLALASATEAAKAIRGGQISSVELTEMMLVCRPFVLDKVCDLDRDARYELPGWS